MALSVEGLTVSYGGEGGVEAVRSATWSIEPGESLGIVGESGSGKSTMGLAIMRLLPEGTVISGKVEVDGIDVTQARERELRRTIRGPTIGMVFQDSLASMNPVAPISKQIEHTIRRHNRALGRAEVRRDAEESLVRVGLPAERLDAYPHQFSGGMRQRAMIAAALAAKPGYLIADESTSDLDTVSQHQILGLLRELKRERNLALILISHDLGVVYHACEQVLVMYGGEIVERGPVDSVLRDPQHEYTQMLVSISRRDRDHSGRLTTLPARLRRGATADARSLPRTPAEEGSLL